MLRQFLALRVKPSSGPSSETIATSPATACRSATIAPSPRASLELGWCESGCLDGTVPPQESLHLRADGCDADGLKLWLDATLETRFKYGELEKPISGTLYDQIGSDFLAEVVWIQREVGDDQLQRSHFFLALLLTKEFEVVGRFFEQRSGVLVNWSYEGELDWESPCELMNEYVTVEAAKRRALTMNGRAGFWLGHNLRLPAARELHCTLHHCGCCPEYFPIKSIATLRPRRSMRRHAFGVYWAYGCWWSSV